MTSKLPAATSSPKEIKTRDEVRDSFNRIGKPVTEWARQHGFKVSLVYAVLDGRAKANRGKSHNIAVLLGLKAGVALASTRRSK